MTGKAVVALCSGLMSIKKGGENMQWVIAGMLTGIVVCVGIDYCFA